MAQCCTATQRSRLNGPVLQWIGLLTTRTGSPSPATATYAPVYDDYKSTVRPTLHPAPSRRIALRIADCREPPNLS